MVHSPLRTSLAALALLAIACGSIVEDPHDCGPRRVDCLGGACSNGVCGPVTLATKLKFARVLTLDDTRVYWADQDGAVSMVPKAGGAPTLLATLSAVGIPSSIATDGDNAYVATFLPAIGGGGIYRVPNDGSGSTLLEGRTDASSVRVDPAGCLVWASFGGVDVPGGVERLCPSAKSPELLAAGGEPSSLALDASAIFWADSVPWVITGFATPCGDPAASLRTLVAGASPVTVASGYPEVSNAGLGADGESLYWRDQCTGVVKRLPHGAAIPTALAAVPSKPFEGSGHYPYEGLVAVDEIGVYTTSDRGVVRVPKDGSNARVVLAGVRAVDIAVDATRVYVLTYDSIFGRKSAELKVLLGIASGTKVSVDEGYLE